MIEAPAADLPAVAKEAEEAWAEIEQSNLGDRMKSALRRIADGLLSRVLLGHGSYLLSESRTLSSFFPRFGPNPADGEHALKQGDWGSIGRTFADTVVDTLAEYAPNIRGVVTQRHILTPVNLESVYGLPEGDLHHGEMTLDQFFHMRPVPSYARYRAPVAGV